MESCKLQCVLYLIYSCTFFYLFGYLKSAILQIVSLIIESAGWCCMLVMILLETRIYIYEFRWYIRFVVIYVLIGEAAMFNLVLSVRQYYSSRYSTFVTSILLMKLFLVVTRNFCHAKNFIMG